MTPASVRFRRRQRGFTLTELMVALVLGALVVLAATAMVVTSRGTYRTQDEATRIAENSRFALELMERLVRIAGYTDFGGYPDAPPSFVPSSDSFDDPIYGNGAPSIGGYDRGSPSSWNSSDSLVVWYFGSGPLGGAADGNILDCAGVAVAPASYPDVKSAGPIYQALARERNVLYIANDVDGEPALFCQRYIYNPVLVSKTTDTQVLIRGVESFQVLYGEAIYAAGADPDVSAPIALAYRTGNNGTNPVVNWQNVQTVRIAMLMRSNVGAQLDPGPVTYNLFGPNYNGSADPGTQVTPPAGTERTRIRRVVSTTVFVRNRVSQWPSLGAP